MQCKNHPDRQAINICAGCGIPICEDCTEEGKSGENYCFNCAMLHSVSEVGTSIKDKRVKSAEKRQREKKKKWGPFQYFVIGAGVLILAMWGFILLGGERAPTGLKDFTKNSRVFLFMVDGALKRYANSEGNGYPETLTDLIPKYLALGDHEIPKLISISYQRDPRAGYFLSLANPRQDDMNIIISPKGIQYQIPPGGGV